MTHAMIDAAGSGFVAAEAAGPLEQRPRQYANYRAVADSSKIIRTHWHITLASGLGWGFDGMNGGCSLNFSRRSSSMNLRSTFRLTAAAFRSG